MRVRIQSITATEKRIFDKLESFRLHLNCSHEEWANSLSLTKKQYEKFYLTRCKGLPLFAFFSLCGRYDLSADLVTHRNFDPLAAAAHYRGNKIHMPERYTVGMFSKRRTMLNMIRYVESNFYFGSSAKIMKLLQITPEILMDADAGTNVWGPIDLLKTAKQFGFGEDHSFALGQHSIAQTIGSPVSKALEKCRNIPEIYKMFLEQEVRYHEKNYIYRYLSKSAKEFIVESIQSEEVAEYLKDKSYGSPEACTFRSGVISMIPKYVGGDELPVRKIKCIHKGDPTCKWLVSFDRKKAKLHA